MASPCGASPAVCWFAGFSWAEFMACKEEPYG